MQQQTHIQLTVSLAMEYRTVTHKTVCLIFCNWVQVQALRSVEKYLQLEKLYVLGTNCVDNGPREGLDKFLQAASASPDTVLHYEFMQVHHCSACLLTLFIQNTAGDFVTSRPACQKLQTSLASCCRHASPG